jgi:G patch domain-containing protein 1
MPAYDDDDDVNDSCVLIGTPLVDLIPEDKKFSNKPKRVEEQIVTDERGRQRFHGAFTGGFSAGYFNSVGTKEGWQPSVFKSSRQERSARGQQRAEDFMDDEDFGDHGIAPRLLAVKTDYKDQSTNAEQQAIKRNNQVLFYDDLIKPVRSTVGVRMLKRMGWREGQGIGPKIKRRLRHLKAKTTTHGLLVFFQLVSIDFLKQKLCF